MKKIMEEAMLCFRVLTEYHVVDICKNLAVRVSIKIRVSQVMGNPHIFCLALYSNLQAKKKNYLGPTFEIVGWSISNKRMFLMAWFWIL